MFRRTKKQSETCPACRYTIATSSGRCPECEELLPYVPGRERVHPGMLVPRYEPYRPPAKKRDIGTLFLCILGFGVVAYIILIFLRVGWRGLNIFIDLLDNLPF